MNQISEKELIEFKQVLKAIISDWEDITEKETGTLVQLGEFLNDMHKSLLEVVNDLDGGQFVMEVNEEARTYLYPDGNTITVNWPVQIISWENTEDQIVVDDENWHYLIPGGWLTVKFLP